MTRAPYRLLGIGAAMVLAANPVSGADLRDLYFGEAFYHAHQGQYFEPLERLEVLSLVSVIEGLSEIEISQVRARYRIGREHHRRANSEQPIWRSCHRSPIPEFDRSATGIG